MIEEVMLASSGWTPEKAVFPYLATPKIDGIRFYVQHGDIWARSNKNVPNLVIRQELPKFLPPGIDGELFYKDYSTSMTQVMTEDHIPSVKICIFDYATDYSIPYMERVKRLQVLVKSLGWKRDDSYALPTYKPPVSAKYLGNYQLVPLYPTWIRNHAQLDVFYQFCLQAGHEGICLRSPASPYRFGRCTLSENFLVKYKPCEDREAKILGVEELLLNTNEKCISETGRAKRSTERSGLLHAGTFGSFHVRDTTTEVAFHVGGGPGLTALVRADLWARRASLTGLIIKYRSMPYGAGEKPRQPQFLGFRDEIDL